MLRLSEKVGDGFTKACEYVSIDSMASLPDEIMDFLFNLPDRERISLAGKLLQSTGRLAESEEAAQAAWDGEIDRRIDDIKSGRVVGVPATEVLKELEEELA